MTSPPAIPPKNSTTSHASAEKPTSTAPLVATGSSQPVVASTPASSQSHHANSSASSLNGRPSMMPTPAVPTIPSGAPAVAHGTSNGGPESHSRTPSVTINSNSGFSGGQTKANSIQFGFQESPENSNTTQTGAAQNVPAPSSGSNPRVTDPQTSPSPIPQPSATGGGQRPVSGVQQGNSITFGTFGGEGERHVRTPSTSQDPNSAHMRRSSSNSYADMNNQQAGRGAGFGPGGGRGRGFQNQGADMRYPPGGGGNFNNRGGYPNQGRNGSTGPSYPRGQAPYSPAAATRSPAMQPAMPQAIPQQPPMMPGQSYYYQPPQAGPTQGHAQSQPYYGNQYYPPAGYQPPMYPNPQMMQHQSPANAFATPYVPGPTGYPPGGHAMSRTSSQVSADHRPASSASQNHGKPTGQGTPQPHPAQMSGAPPVAQSPQFARPVKKSAAIAIKNPQGDSLDLSALQKPKPASPALNSQPSKTPPVVSSTPPPKAPTPAHNRSESNIGKTALEIRQEFQQRVAATNTAVEKTQKDDEPQPAASKPTEETKADPEPAKAAEKTEPQAQQTAEAPAAGDNKAEAPKETEEEEMERMIREMEEAEAEREKKEEAHRAKKALELEAKKKAEEANKASNAAENDRKLREQEREMERLEEEKEARAKANEGRSVHELLSGQAPEASAEANDAADKMANLSLNDKASGAKQSPVGRGNKPAALNLAPIKTNSVEPPQPSAALRSLETARLLDVIKNDIYPPNIQSPNPAVNAAVSKKGTSFQYDPQFLLQFKGVYTEKPSMDFDKQVKTLIGDDGSKSATRTPSRASNAKPGVPMGSFSRTLPFGTSSEDRFQRSNSKPSVGSMGGFPRPSGVFPVGQSSRAPSFGMPPNSPRQASKPGRGSRGPFQSNKNDEKAAKTMPMTQGMKIDPLSISTTGWKPTSIGRGAASAAQPSGLLDAVGVQKKVKSNLNKMTPENFEKISGQILDIAAQSKEETDGRTLRQVIQLTFEKATDEAHWASMYAKFAKKMLETMSPEIRDESIRDKAGQVVSGGALFRKYLLNRCQEEFERGWKTNIGENPDEKNDGKKPQEVAMMSDEYYKAAAAKRRGLGLVQFIGELYKLSMLTERIMHECVKKLVDYQGTPDEAEVESLCKLLRTIGLHLDSNDRGKPMMDIYFQRIQATIDLPELPSRMKFMLMDVVDLRRSGWVSKETNKGPKTLDEIRADAEAAAAAKAADAARSNQRGGPGGRSQMGRGDARGYGGTFPQAAQNQVGMDDLRRLKGGANRTSSSNMTLGPMSMLNSRSNSGRRLGPGGSLTRGNEDSAASSRTGTPPVRENSTNAFSLLANMESENPGSPPSTNASPALAKVNPDTAGQKPTS